VCTAALALSSFAICTRLIVLAQSYGNHKHEKDFKRFQSLAIGGAMMCLTLVACIGISTCLLYAIQHYSQF
jgi:hypothetical protein